MNAVLDFFTPVIRFYVEWFDLIFFFTLLVALVVAFWNIIVYVVFKVQRREERSLRETALSFIVLVFSSRVLSAWADIRVDGILYVPWNIPLSFGVLIGALYAIVYFAESTYVYFHAWRFRMHAAVIILGGICEVGLLYGVFYKLF